MLERKKIRRWKFRSNLEKKKMLTVERAKYLGTKCNRPSFMVILKCLNRKIACNKQ